MTRQLLASADRYWPHIDGSHEGDLLDLPVDRFLNRIYWWLTKDANAEGVERFDAQLWMPPPGVVAPQGPWTAEAETAAFGSLASQVNASPSPNSGT